MEKLLRILKLIGLTLCFLFLFANILYWGLIFVSVFIGVWAYGVIGIALLFLIAGYVKIFKSIIKKNF